MTLGNLSAGPIKDMATNNPDGMMNYIHTADYPTLLQFVQDAYAEHLAAPDDAILQYVWTLAINEADLTKQIPLATDFSLSQGDLAMKQLGARAIWLATLQGATPTPTQKEQAITKLKAQLSALTTPSQEAFQVALYTSNALLVLGDDAGLDALLTSKEDVSNYRAKDNWTPTSTATVFQTLATQYTQLGNDPNTANNDVEKTTAAFYRRAKERRDQNKEVKALQPLVNLDQIKK